MKERTATQPADPKKFTQAACRFLETNEISHLSPYTEEFDWFVMRLQNLHIDLMLSNRLKDFMQRFEEKFGGHSESSNLVNRFVAFFAATAMASALCNPELPEDDRKDSGLVVGTKALNALGVKKDDMKAFLLYGMDFSDALNEFLDTGAIKEPELLEMFHMYVFHGLTLLYLLRHWNLMPDPENMPLVKTEAISLESAKVDDEVLRIIEREFDDAVSVHIPARGNA